MYPTILKIGFLTIHSWGVMLSTAIISGTYFTYYISKKKNPLYTPYIFDGIIYVIIASIIGCSLFYIIEHIDYYSKHPLDIIMLQNGGLNIYGGLITSIITIYIYSKIKKINIPEILDICTAPFFLGMAIGRIGCFLNGCCYGIQTKLPFGIKFPDTLYPAHPTQIYDLIMNLIFMAYIIISYDTKRYHGHVLLRGVLMMSTFRFLIEIIRSNPRYFLGLSQAQYISITAFIISSFILFKNRNTAKSK